MRKPRNINLRLAPFAKWLMGTCISFFVKQAAATAVLNFHPIGPKAAYLFNRKFLAFLTALSIMLGGLILPQRWMPFMRSAEAAGTVLSSWGFEGVTTSNTGQVPVVSAG